jgi:hypothetical protein
MPSTRKYKVLTWREARAVMAVAETMFPAGGNLKTTVEEAEVVTYVDNLLASMQLKERILVRCLFTLFEVQLLVTQPTSPKRFSKASLEERTSSLVQWDKSSLHMQRVAFQALRSIILWAYVDNPTVAREIGIKPGTDVIARQQIKQAVLGARASSAAK